MLHSITHICFLRYIITDFCDYAYCLFSLPIKYQEEGNI